MLVSCAAPSATGTEKENTGPEVSAEVETDETADKEELEIEETPEVLEYEQAMWNYLMDQYHNPVAAAAILGNAQGESSLLPYRLSNDIEKGKNGDYPLSKAYAEKVDNGTISRDDFIYAPAGYDSFGLFAWYGEARKTALYDYAAEKGVSIADWKMQLDFAYKEIIERYYKLYTVLMTETDIKTATDAFTQIYEQASNDDLYNNDKRTTFAKRFYSRFWGVRETIPLYEAQEMLPIYQSYEYFDEQTIGFDEKVANVYAYMLQIGLLNLDYPVGPASGFFGTSTEQAVLQFQKDNGLPETGIFTPADWAVLAELNGIER